jgi:hypothetical protein
MYEKEGNLKKKKTFNFSNSGLAIGIAIGVAIQAVKTKRNNEEGAHPDSSFLIINSVFCSRTFSSFSCVSYI